MKLKKAQAKLEARIQAYEKMKANRSLDFARYNYTKPGSMKGR